MKESTTYTRPFLHYQVHQVDVKWGVPDRSQAKLELEGSQFLPSYDGESFLFQTKEAGIRAVVYNLYLYTENEVLIETFVHKFRELAEIQNHYLRVPMTDRSIRDVFPRHVITGDAAELTVWQFLD